MQADTSCGTYPVQYQSAFNKGVGRGREGRHIRGVRRSRAPNRPLHWVHRAKVVALRGVARGRGVEMVSRRGMSVRARSRESAAGSRCGVVTTTRMKREVVLNKRKMY